MTTSDSVARLEWLMDRLVGQPCFNVLASEGDEYTLVLHIGERRPRSLRLANPRLSFLQRTYEGQLGLLVECPWRIEGPDGVAASCFEPRKAGERGQRAAAELAGRKIEVARAEAPGYDLLVGFDGGWSLRAFALECSERPRRDNWSVWAEADTVVVGPHSRLASGIPDDPAPSRKIRAVDDPDADPIARWRDRLKHRRGSNDE